MKKIVEFSVKFPVTIVMMVLGILLLGYISYDKLGVDLFPNLNNPRLFVEVTAGERPPEEMERQFIEDIEALSIRQSGVTDVQSASRVGTALLEVEYSWEKDMDEAFLDLQRALNGFAQNSELEELTISRFDPNSRPVMEIAFSGRNTNDMNELRKVAENYIRNELIRLEGIADVKISGEEEPEVIIDTDPYRLESFGLTADDISAQIQNYNRNVSGGSIEEMSKQYVIKGLSIFHDLEDLENLVVSYREEPMAGGTSASSASAGEQTEGTANRVPVFLKDVATVSFRNSEPVNITKLNGERCLGLSIYKETRYNTLKAVEQLEIAMQDIKNAVPGYEFVVVQNQGDFISEAIWEVEEAALLGALFAVIILFVFLRRIGSTLIISIAIPISIIATFNLMYFNDLTLNIMTLGGLALGAGMLVDNAIVVLENIYRFKEQGLSYKEAAIQGTSQVGGAITASTITTIIVFLPIVYLQGASGELFKDQAWTVAFSLISSLFVAIFVIPMLISTLYKDKSTQKEEPKSVKLNFYGNLLGRILDRRAVVIIVGLLLVATGAWMATQVGSEYMPTAETKEFNVEISLPEGTRLERTAEAVTNIEGIIRSLVSESEAQIYSVSGPPENQEEQTSFEGENSGSLKVILTDSAKYSTAALMGVLNRTLGGNSDLNTLITRDQSALQSILGTDEAPLVVEIAGEDLETMESIALQVENLLKEDTDLYNVKSSMEVGLPEIEVEVDRLQARLNNVTVESITTQIENRLKGTPAGQLDHEGEMKNILIKLPDVSKSELEAITINSGEQELPLTTLANIRVSNSPKEIARRNQNRIISVSAGLNTDKPLDQVVASLEASLSAINVPSDYRLSIQGEEVKRKESLGNLTFAMVLSIILVYMVLASQFESLIHPFTILLTIPLAGVGAIMIFFFMGLSLNIMAFIGIIMLIGIAVNDSIILVDAINQLKESGLDRKTAIIQAGQYRIRPILMTSLTTILALLPLTFGFGEGASLRQPMALAVIGGLVTSTLLTLVVIPCVYYVFDQVKDFLFTSSKSAA